MPFSTGWACVHNAELNQIELIHLNPACGCSEARYTIDTVKHIITFTFKNMCAVHCKDDQDAYIGYYDIMSLEGLLLCLM